MNLIKFFKEIGDGDVGLVGGKGLSLGRMTQAGLPVPAGFVITTELFKDFKTTGVLSEANQQLLYDTFDTLGEPRVAVRSSAISEDSAEASWAGQFESYMNVGRDGLLQSVQDCWESVKGAADYADTQGLKQEELVLAVVVQKMVDSDVSGVAFSVNPLNKSTDEIMIEATYGLGELLVQGMVTPDNYVIAKSDGSVISKHITNKTTMLAYESGETKEIPVSAGQDEACLSDEQLAELSELIRRAEDYYQTPQDMEWALQDGSFYLVQSRPITTI